jgi:hypothetical protein
MVSNTLHMDLQELLDALARIKKEHGASREYRELRRGLPADWPM